MKYPRYLLSLIILFSIILGIDKPATANSIITPAQQENVALGKSVTVVTNGANDNRESPGLYPSDITDGSLNYLPSSWAQEDGTVGYVNNDYNQTMVITVTIDLQGLYDISLIRYNMGNVERAETWNADVMVTPFGTTGTNPGSPYQGVWTEQSGTTTLSTVTITLIKTRTSWPTDWLFIGEIEIYGISTSLSRPVFDLPFMYPNRGHATESEFVAAWKRCTTSFFDHYLPFKKDAKGDGLLWLWTGDVINQTGQCQLFQNCYDGHEGFDFDDLSCYGTAVYPAAGGDILAAETGWFDDGYGNRIVIKHGETGYKTLYGHLAKILVSSGAVTPTTQIGIIGETGCPGCGTHLHFSVYYNNKVVDPSGWEGWFADPNETQNQVKSYRQWLYSVRRRTPVNNTYGTTLVAPSGSSVISIPANAYTQDYELNVTELAAIDMPPQISSAGHAFILLAKDQLGNLIQQFTRDYSVEVRFTSGDIAGVYGNTLSLYFWDTQYSQWIPLPTIVHTTTTSQMGAGVQTTWSATASTSRLGYIGLMGTTRYTTNIPMVQR